MGADTSKVGSPDEEETKSLLCKVFQVSNLKDIGPINATKLEEVWRETLTPELITLFAQYVERKVVSRKKCDDKKVVYSLFHTFVRGNDSEIAELLACLFNLQSKPGTPEGSDSFHIDELVKYIKNLFGSFLKGLESEKNEALSWWNKGDVSNSTDIQQVIINHLIREIKTDDNVVSMEGLEKWLNRSPFVLNLQGDVIKKAFCYHQLLGPYQTHLPTPDFSIVDKTRLDIHQVMYLSNSLLPDLRKKWRLVFSSRYSGESWVIFLKQVIDQGPTIIVIWDKKGKCFGGYASSSWSLSPHFYGDDKCFLFTLLPTLQRFEPTNYNKNFQYINTAQQTFPNGLGMGGQLDYWGLYIDSSMKTGKVSVSCSTFANYQQPSDLEFEMDDIEVWAVGEKPIKVDPDERQRSVLDTQTEAQAVLEMMGKTQASAGLREPDPEVDPDPLSNRIM